MDVKRKHTAKVSEEQRFVDFAIGIFPEIPSKNAVRKYIKKELLYINGELASTANWVRTNDEIVLIEDLNKLPQSYKLPIDIIYEDKYFAVVVKPSGIVVSGNVHKTLEHALIGQLKVSSEEDAYRYARAVHRIDLATIGLVVLAKTISASQSLAKQFHDREVEKWYVALLAGEGVTDQTIELEIDEKPAKTSLSVRKKVKSIKNEEITWVDLKPETGRKHQLRKHCLAIGHPIVGDKLYNEKGKTIQHKGMFLFARKLMLNHPVTLEKLVIEADVPPKFEALMIREQRIWDRWSKGQN